jgi:2-methylcitrate dehydratase PrpD
VFTEEVVADATIRDLTSRVALTVDDAIGEQQAVVTLRLRDGTALTYATEMAKGNPANPLTDAEIEAKFLALSEPVIGPVARDLASQLWRFGEVADVGAWLAAAPAGKGTKWTSI